jgi:hypothetical protein
VPRINHHFVRTKHGTVTLLLPSRLTRSISPTHVSFASPGLCIASCHQYPQSSQIKSLYPGPLRRLCLSLPHGGVSTCREDGLHCCRDGGHSHRFLIFPSSYIEGLMFIHLVTCRYSFIIYNHSVLEIPFLRLALLLCARRLR